MFIARKVGMELIKALRKVVEEIAKKDRDLANQVRRAGSSIVLNLDEGSRRTGRDRMHLWKISAGSAAEVRAALEVAELWGYIEEPVEVKALLDRVLALLWRLTHARQAPQQGQRPVE